MKAKKEEKKVKLNDKKNNKKKKSLKQEKYISEEAREVRKFVIILLSIIVIVLIIFGVSKLLIKTDVEDKGEKTVSGEINYDIVSIGTMLNRTIDEYYVLIYDGKDKESVIYSSIMSKYMKSKDAKKIYYCDLGNRLNSDYKAKDNTTNPKAKNISELSLGKITLIKVNKGKIVKYIEDVDTIKNELAI